METLGEVFSTHGVVCQGKRILIILRGIIL